MKMKKFRKMNNLKTQTSELEMNTDIRAVNCNEEMTWRTYRMSRIKHVCDRPLRSHLGFVRFLQRIVRTGSKQKPDVPIPSSSSVASCLLGLPQNWIGKLCWKTLWCFRAVQLALGKIMNRVGYSASWTLGSEEVGRTPVSFLSIVRAALWS